MTNIVEFGVLYTLTNMGIIINCFRLLYSGRKSHYFTSLPDDACVMQSIGWMNSSYETNDDLVLSDLARYSEFEKGECVWRNSVRYLFLVYLKKEKKVNRLVD